MVRRGKLQIMYDVLDVVRKNRGSIRQTPLQRKSNMSSDRFKKYIMLLADGGFVEVRSTANKKLVFLTEKGMRFLQKYSTIVAFIDEFDLQ